MCITFQFHATTGFFFFRLTLITLTASGAAMVVSSCAFSCGGCGGDVELTLLDRFGCCSSSSPSTTYSSNLPVDADGRAVVDAGVAEDAVDDKSTSIACFFFFLILVVAVVAPLVCPFVVDAPSGISSIRTTSAGAFDFAVFGGGASTSSSSDSSLTMGMLSTSTSSFFFFFFFPSR